MADEATKMGLDGLASEGMPSLAEFADEPGGAWPVGWYKAKVLEGFSTNSGKQFRTEEVSSNDGMSRNLWLAVEVTGQGGTRKMRTNFNYRPEDFHPDRLERIKEARTTNKGVKGAWQGQKDLQRSSISIGQLGMLEKAFGFGLQRHPETKNLLPSVFIGKAVDVRLGVDDKGYNEITQFAAAGSKAR